MKAVLEVRNLHFRYADGTPALNGIDFTLAEGETVALLGANGSGKTTFLMHLNGLLTGEGSIQVCGMAMEKPNLRAIRAKIGMVFQDSESQLFMPTVLDDVMFGPLNQGRSAAEAAKRGRAALETVGMAHAAGRAPYHLSAGEKKRVAIAGILAMDPEILVLDEPTTFLDPPGQRALADLLVRLPQAKILVTHDARFAQALSHRAVFFQSGKIVAEGSVEELARRFAWDLEMEGAR